MKTVHLKSLLMGVSMLLSTCSSPVLAFELKPDGSMVLHPQEQIIFDKCKADKGGCIIINREILMRVAEDYAQGKIDELQAQVQENFDKAVKIEAKTLANNICKNSI